MDVLDLQAKQAASIRACDQQFQVEKDVQQLKSGISAAQLTIRRKKDELEDLQTRVLRLSKTLHDPSEEKNFAKNKLLQQEEIRRHQHGMKRCKSCGKDFVVYVFANHEAGCTGSEKQAQLHAPTSASLVPSRSLPEVSSPRNINQIMDQAQETRKNASGGASTAAKQRTLPCFVSQPPRNLRVAANGGSITHSSILLQWDPPIFTGSTPIIDYELHFSICHTVKRMKDGEMSATRKLEPIPPQSTSRWCLQVPVAQNEFWVRDLVSDQEYGAFSIRAITRNGKSQPSNQVERIATATAVPPSKPYLLCLGAVTAKTITLAWKEPMDDGGKAIEFYEICFNEAIMEETITDNAKKNFLDVSETVYKPRRVRTNSTATTFTLTDLLSGKAHKDFQVRAVNRAGIPGDFCDAIESICTIGL